MKTMKFYNLFSLGVTLMALLWNAPIAQAQDTLVMNITVNSQAQVNVLSEMLEGKTTIDGDVRIGYTGLGAARTNITDLSPLGNITNITGHLTIQLNAHLTNLNALTSLQSIGGDFYVGGNDNLLSLALPALSSIGGDFSVGGNDNLPSLGAFPALSSIGGDFSVGVADNLLSLGVFPALSSIGGYFRVTDNDNLLSLGALPALSFIGSGRTQVRRNIENNVSIWIEHNNNLVLCSALEEFLPGRTHAVTGDIYIRFNALGCNDEEQLDDLILATQSENIFEHKDSVSAYFIVYSNVRWKLTKPNGADWITSLSVDENTDASTITGENEDTVTLAFSKNTGALRSAPLTLTAIDENDAELTNPAPFVIRFTQWGNETVYTGDIVLTSQYAVNNLSLPENTTFIQGNVTIGYSNFHDIRSDITDLSSFSNITGITGNLRIQQNGQLANLNALTSLQSIGGYFSVWYNDSLTHIGNFDNLQSIGGDFRVSNNDKLTQMGNFDALQSIGGYFSVSGNDILTHTGNFDALQSIGGYFSVWYNDILTHTGNFDALQSIGGYFSVSGNDILTHTGNFDALQSIGGFFVVGNDKLTQIGNFDVLQSIGGDFSVSNNDSLTQIGNFDALDSIGGYFNMNSNVRLTHPGNFDNLRSIGGYFQVEGNDSLTQMGNFDALESIGGYFWVNDNASLTQMGNFDALESIGGYFWVNDNASLTQMGNFDALESIGGYFWVADNNKLTRIRNFNNLRAIGGYFQVDDNDKLTQIGNFDALESIGGYFYVYDNIKLTRIRNFNNLRAIGEYFDVSGIYNLTQIGNFDALQSIGGNFSVVTNRNLTQMGNFDALESIGGYFQVINNDSLTQMGSFDNLRAIGGDFEILNNDNLLSLDTFPELSSIGVRELFFFSEPVNRSIIIENNDNLVMCASLKEFFPDGDNEVEGGIYIGDNAPGCNSEEEIKNNPPTDIMLSATDIQENAPADTMIATITATDQDESDTHTYTLGGSDLSSFRILNGVLYARKTFDFEDQSSYEFSLTVNDGKAGSYSKDFTIAITDINEAPTDITLSHATIKENQLADDRVATITVTDQDKSDTHTYTLSGTGLSSFLILNGVLYARESFDFETKASYAIIITANDGNGGSYSKDFTIAVTDVNEAPTDIQLSDATIQENQPADARVATITATDPDESDTHTYTLSGSDASSFLISNAILYTRETFNFETENSYNITITANDGNGGTYSKDFIIAITDVNEAPTDIQLSDATIQENQPDDARVATITDTDPDESDTHTYTLSGSDASSFRISNNVLYARETFDFETKNSYNITITANDGNGGSYSKDFTIAITDVNEVPTDIQLSQETIQENQPDDASVATLSATDPDESDTHTYTLSGSDASSFLISNGVLYTRKSFDFETKASYAITIEVNDGNGGTYSKNFTITVTDEENEVLSVNKLSESAQIFPTVAQDEFTLTIDHQVKGAIQLSIYAVNGAVVQTERYHKIARTLSKKVDISRLSKGVYVVNIQMDDQAVVSRKVVKR